VAHGATVVAEFEDLGVRGATPLGKRVGLNEALDALTAQRAGVLLVATRDRLARDVIVSAVVERLVERQGARVMAAEGPGNGDSPEAELMRRIVDAFASYERMIIAARTRAAVRVKKLRGVRIGGVPLGFRLSADPCRIEPDSGGQGVIGLVRQLRSHGLSLRQIDEELRARGHRPRGGGHWHVQTLANISRPEAVVCAVQGEATNYKKSLAGSSSESLVPSLRQGRDVRIHADRIDPVLVGHRRGRRRGSHDGEANAIGRTGAGAAPPSP
jgi:DNA invertase Pin-like site-specific DNA recombinase